MKKVTMAAAARQTGVSRQAVSKARRTGRLVTDDDGMVEPARAEAVLGKRRGRPVEPVPGADANMTHAEAVRRKEAALCQIREVELAKLRGELLPAEDVRRADETIYAALRDRLRSIPMSLAPLIVEAAHKPNAEHGVFALMLSSIDEALTDISTAKIIPVDDGNEMSLTSRRS